LRGLIVTFSRFNKDLAPNINKKVNRDQKLNEIEIIRIKKKG
jgi:hypothetical protein